ncbi:MAG: TIGR02270 family protein [Minicystis sp.]
MLHDILERHRDELSFLRLLRAAAVHAPHFDLRTLADLDERVEAHLDGLRIAGEAGFAVVRDALDPGEPGIAFAAAALAIERADRAMLDPILELAAAEPEIARAVTAAFGWVAPDRAVAAAERLLHAGAPPRSRALGIAAHAAHRRDPGGVLANAILDPDPTLRARALRAAGELGRRDLAPEVIRARTDADEHCRFWAAWSGLLLAEVTAVPVLYRMAESASPYALRAMLVVARVLDPRDALPWLESLAARPEHARVAFQGAGALGDPGAVPWLLARMEDPALARLAADAFTMITGIAVENDLATKAPAGFRLGPSDDPADDDVALDPDRDRPWPAPAALAAAFRARGGDLRRGSPLPPRPAHHRGLDASRPARRPATRARRRRHRARPARARTRALRGARARVPAAKDGLRRGPRSARASMDQ